jgi:hypothetical protein
VALVVNPVAHNYYYVLLLPLIVGLVDRSLPITPRALDWKLFAPLAVFAVTDFAARLPRIGNSLRDIGVPLLSLLYLMWVGASVLVKERSPVAGGDSKELAQVPEDEVPVPAAV